MLCTITIDLFKGLKQILSLGNLVDSPTGESGNRFSITNISANSKPNSEGLVV
jgi:hypothetical protein